MRVFKVIYEQDEDGRFNISCPELKGCHSYGNSVDEAMANIREAIELYIEDVSQEDLQKMKVNVMFGEIAV